MSVKSPGSVSFDADELERIERARVAIILGIPPRAVDDMPIQDRIDVIQIDNAQKELTAWYQSKRR